MVHGQTYGITVQFPDNWIQFCRLAHKRCLKYCIKFFAGEKTLRKLSGRKIFFDSDCIECWNHDECVNTDKWNATKTSWNKEYFLARDATQSAILLRQVVWLSVRPSIRLSVTLSIMITKIILCLISLACSLSADYKHGSTPTGTAEILARIRGGM